MLERRKIMYYVFNKEEHCYQYKGVNILPTSQYKSVPTLTTMNERLKIDTYTKDLILEHTHN